MTWPALQVKTNFDQSSDDPKSARSEIAGNVDKFNQLQAHVSSFMQGVLDDADAAAARTTLKAISTAGVGGDILYASGTNTWARLAKGTDGESLILASGIPSWGAGGATVVAKTVDETVNNSTTLQDDDHLFFAMAVNKTYIVDVTLLLDAASATPDHKIGWTVPAGCTMLWANRFSSAWNGVSNLLSDSSSTTINSTTGTTGGVLRAFVRNGANAGNLQLQWAQATANASNSKLLKHSHMIIRELGAT